MSEPLYGCEHEDCAEECCYPANMLRVYEGKVWCEGCWENSPTIWPDGQGGDTGCDWLHWDDLEPFVPEHEKRIEEKDEQLKVLRQKCDALMVFLNEMKPQLTGRDQRIATEIIEREDARYPRPPMESGQ
jgi:hypothetical protein